MEDPRRGRARLRGSHRGGRPRRRERAAAGPPLPPGRDPARPALAGRARVVRALRGRQEGRLAQDLGRAGDAGREERPGLARGDARRGQGGGARGAPAGDRGAGLRAGPARPAPLDAGRLPGRRREPEPPRDLRPRHLQGRDHRRRRPASHRVPAPRRDGRAGGRLAPRRPDVQAGDRCPAAVRRSPGEEDDEPLHGPGPRRWGGGRGPGLGRRGDGGRGPGRSEGAGGRRRPDPGDPGRRRDGHPAGAGRDRPEARRRRPLHHPPRPAPGAAPPGDPHGHHLHPARAAPRLRPRRPAPEGRPRARRRDPADSHCS